MAGGRAPWLIGLAAASLAAGPPRAFGADAGAAATDPASLARALRAPDKQVRLAAVTALYEKGGNAGAASVAPLIAALNDPDADVRARAAQALGTLGTWSWQDDPAHEEANRAAQAAQKPLAAIASDPRQPIDVRRQAAAALAGMPVDARLGPALGAALSLADDDVRVLICQALARARSREAVPALEARLRDGNSKVQVAAVEALLATGAGKRPVARLARLLVEPTVPMADRAKATYVLWDHPAEARPALRALVELALMPHEHLIERMPSDGREEARHGARRAIDRIGAPAVPFIVPYLNPKSRSDFEEERRRDAISALCALGPAARAAVPALMPLVASHDPETRGEVASCLVANIRVAPQAIAPKALRLLSDRDAWVVHEVVHATRYLGPAAAPALPRLRTLARDREATVRADAIDTIGAIGARAASARPELEAALSDGDANVQVAAALALVETRADPAGGLARLFDLLAGKGKPPGAVRRAQETAAWRLGELASQPEGKQVLSVAIDALGSESAGIREGLAHTIAAFGPDAAATALGPLTTVIGRDRYGPGKEACAALAGFGPKMLPAVPAMVESLAGEPGWAFRALLTTARRSPEIATAVKAQCAPTKDRQLFNCRVLIRAIDAREDPPPLP